MLGKNLKGKPNKLEINHLSVEIFYKNVRMDIVVKQIS
jgi:hypothetical protein